MFKLLPHARDRGEREEICVHVWASVFQAIVSHLPLTSESEREAWQRKAGGWVLLYQHCRKNAWCSAAEEGGDVISPVYHCWAHALTPVRSNAPKHTRARPLYRYCCYCAAASCFYSREGLEDRQSGGGGCDG